VPDALGVITNSGTIEIQMKTVQIEDNNYASVDDPANKNHSKLRSIIMNLTPRTIATASSGAQSMAPLVTQQIIENTANPGIDEGANNGSYGNATSNSSNSSIPTIDNGTITSSSSEDSSISDYLSNNPGQDSSSSSEDSGENYCCRTLDYRFEACGDINRSVPADMCCQDKSRDTQGQDHKKLSEEIASAERSVEVWKENVWIMNAANYFVQGSALATDMFRCPEKTIDDLPTVRSLGTLADYIKKKATESGFKEISKNSREGVLSIVEKNLGTSSKIDSSAPMERALIHATQDYVVSKCDAFVATGKVPDNVVKEIYGWMEKSMKHSLKITQQRSDDAQRRLTELYKELEALGPEGERQTNISEWAMCMQSFHAPSPAKYK
jgi:hypothetical protein